MGDVPAIAIMAAGQSRRFGADKLVRPCSGKPLYQWALETASATSGSIYLVVDANNTGNPVDADGARRLTNPDPALGLGSSLRIAAQAAWADGHRQLLVMLADMPLVSANTLKQLIQTPGATVGCRYPDGRSGVPAIFRDGAMHALVDLNPSSGAQLLLQKLDQRQVVRVAHEELLDVDTPEMLAQAAAALAIRGRS